MENNQSHTAAEAIQSDMTHHDLKGNKNHTQLTFCGQYDCKKSTTNFFAPLNLVKVTETCTVSRSCLISILFP